MILIYPNHLNLSFNKEVLINDLHALLTGTEKIIRHIPIIKKEDLIKSVIGFVIIDMNKSSKSLRKTISKINLKKSLQRNDQ